MEEQLKQAKNLVLSELTSVFDKINYSEVRRLCEDIQKARKIFVIGVGRVELALQAFAKRLGHLGYDVHCVGEICEPAIEPGDLLIVGSGSGKSVVPVAIAKKAFNKGAMVVHIGSDPGDIYCVSGYRVTIPTVTKTGNKEGKVESQQIMTSLFEQTLLLLGDIISKVLLEQSNRTLESLWKFHANLE